MRGISKYFTPGARIVFWTAATAVLLFASGIVPTAYQTVKNASVALTQRNTINCTGSLTCSDVAGETQFSVATGAGGVTSVATGCGLSGGPITSTGTIISSQAVNAQTGTTYTFADSDCSKLVTFTNGSSIAATLPQAGAASSFISGWWMHVENRGAGTLTITPTTSTIDGAASLALVTNQGVYIGSNGANYFTMRGMGATTNQNIRSFGGSFDGAGSVLTTGKVAYVTVPYGCTIAAYNILVDAGTADFDVWKIATGTAIPTVANTIISGSSYLAISSGTALHSTTTSSFTTTTVTANDIVGISLHAVTTATVAQLTIQCNAT